jgi:hypothetical protein
MKRSFQICWVILILGIPVFGQDSTKVSNVQWSGYLKFFESQTFDHLNQNQASTHLVHNRLRIKWKITPKLSLQSEVRNRLYWGSGVRLNPFFESYLRNANEWLNLSNSWINQYDLVAHSNIDRFFLDWKREKWNIRIGRQRINWGMASIWNPNDMFNAYNFLDVDYEERPGSDALKFQYNFNHLSSLDIVYAQIGKDKSISAARYFFNYSTIDYQVILGNYLGAGTFGIGLAGALGDAGIKAEVQHYLDNPNESVSHTNLTIGLDYMFTKGWYFSSGYLFNSQGLNEPVSNWNGLNFRLSSKNLMPTKHNYLLVVNKQINPLSSISLTSIFAPQTNLLIAVPSFTYSVSNNVEVNIFWQAFFAEMNNTFKPATNVLMGRIRWSF